MTANKTQAILLGLDLLQRHSFFSFSFLELFFFFIINICREVRVLDYDYTYEYCKVAEEIRDWCGINATTYPDALRYCIISEKWPQPDMCILFLLLFKNPRLIFSFFCFEDSYNRIVHI